VAVALVAAGEMRLQVGEEEERLGAHLAVLPVRPVLAVVYSPKLEQCCGYGSGSYTELCAGSVFILQRQGFGSVFVFTDPDTAFKNEYGSGSRIRIQSYTFDQHKKILL